MQFLRDDAKFMDPVTNHDYERRFTGESLMRYELIARLCVGYLDDLYFLGTEKEMKTWFRGSIRLFGGTHRTWLERHADAYDPKFHAFVIKELEEMNNAARALNFHYQGERPVDAG